MFPLNNFFVKNFFLKTTHHWKLLLKDRAFKLSLLAGVFVFAFGNYINYVASVLKDSSYYEPAGDLILDKIPTYDLEFLFTYGIYFIVFLTVLYPLFFKPEDSPFMLKTYGLLFLVRAAFISMTQIGPPAGFLYANGIEIATGPLRELMFQNDLFFSGHTAVPFMSFLLLKDTKFRWFMFFGSLVMGATVLLMHVHYSIDVFAAFFITYGIYAFSDTIFNKLNVRFRRRVKMYGWDSWRKRLNTLREKRIRRRRFLEGDDVLGLTDEIEAEGQI